MNSRIRIALAGAACLAGCAITLADTTANPSLSADSQITSPAPSQGYVWMGGQWNSENGQWKWVAAHWDLPPSRSATWVAGHWISSSGSWVWVNGAWNVGEASQAQAGPPQPPGQYSQTAGQGQPMPSTPAPYVDGQFQGQSGPGGVDRVIDQPPSTVDYGPADYSVDAYPGYYAYPGYGWAGDPWFWGGYPLGFVGFGFGRGFYGHGFYGHGFRGRGFGRAGFGGHVSGANFGGGHFGGHGR
jgi:hypothetical protein